MIEVIIVKFIIISLFWTCGWILRFAHTGAEQSSKNILITFAPWIIFVLYFLIFWWG